MDSIIPVYTGSNHSLSTKLSLLSQSCNVDMFTDNNCITALFASSALPQTSWRNKQKQRLGCRFCLRSVK